MPSGVQEELPGRPYGWVWRWSHRRHKLEWERNVSKCEPCVSSGKLCIEVTPQSKIAWISESLCIGCGICIKVILAPEYLAGNDLFRLLLVTTFKLLRVCLKFVSWLFLLAEMSVWSTVDCQPSQQPGEGNHTQILRQLLQTAPVRR